MKIVHKVEEGMDPKDIYCTTYQMRDVFQQVSTAWVGSLEVMSLLMHQSAAFMAKSGDNVLDVCCGRAMILPFLRRHRPKILSYTGVDIHAPNMHEAMRKAAMSKIEGRLAPNWSGSGEPYYPFIVNLVQADCSDMYDVVANLHVTPLDFIVYMASIEHMQKETGEKSLIECYRLLKPGGRMFLTSPNTRDKRDPYDTQYAAHLYEWSREELLEAAGRIGFKLVNEMGLLAKVRGYKEALEDEYPEYVEVFDQFEQYMPSAWLYSIFPILTPKIADEVGLVLTK